MRHMTHDRITFRLLLFLAAGFLPQHPCVGAAPFTFEYTGVGETGSALELRCCRWFGSPTRLGHQVIN